MMAERLIALWNDMAQTPLLWLTITVVIYQGASTIYRRSNHFPLFHPVLIAIVILVALLRVTGIEYATYFEGSQFIHFLLGPATVALAIPLHTYYQKVQQMFVPIVGALFAGSIIAIVSAVGIAWALGASQPTLLSLMPKSVTTPIAMGVAEKVGGIPSLTAVLVILTGVVGAVVGKELLDLVRIREPAVQGFAIGLASHGIGTARAFQINAETGAFSGLGMGLNGVLTAIIVPLIVGLIGV
jgi:predicted murein hydrolase (TIGR00659 family)